MSYLEEQAFNQACTDMNNAGENTDVFDFLCLSL